jgi:hypothetical protein
MAPHSAHRGLPRIVMFGAACLAATVAVSYGSALLWASTTASTTIQACENNGTGLLRIVSNQTQCLKQSETPLSWYQNGQPGPAGQRGLAGPVGPAGASGENGRPGPSNITGVQGLPVGNSTCSNGGYRFLTKFGSYTVCNGQNGKSA